MIKHVYPLGSGDADRVMGKTDVFQANYGIPRRKLCWLNMSTNITACMTETSCTRISCGERLSRKPCSGYFHVAADVNRENLKVGSSGNSFFM